MHWPITFLIIHTLLSAQMRSHMYVIKLKSRILTFHLKMLKYKTGPFLWRSCRMLKVEPMILQQGQMKYIIKCLKYLPKSSLSSLLNIFNTIWISGDFPSVWRTAIIINIPKPGKDPTNTTNYRLIAILMEHPLIGMMNPIPYKFNRVSKHI